MIFKNSIRVPLLQPRRFEGRIAFAIAISVGLLIGWATLGGGG